jgi:hypothetical protein
MAQYVVEAEPRKAEEAAEAAKVGDSVVADTTSGKKVSKKKVKGS